ncbi:NAD binding Rossmann fold oxidoreductase like [Lecanosticta acicola]|uniref:NAD binding Rossmann fold oxidoreductase like n=1 Tax=Lecanosticta acicola TaxID=111012 RepID=A0AAI8YTL7_9PEZI|nr:NAD binding Rossmann fold oxidoreductase like [Lecanosticta acicola]
MASKPFNVAVVGYGLSAKVFHIPLVLALPNNFKLYGIVQRSPKPGDDAGQDHAGIKSWRSVDEVYTDPDVDVVIVTSVPETHFDMCKSSLEAGKNVVVEKPFVPTAKEAGKLAEIAKKTGKKLAVYQNRRWDADFLTLKKILSEGSFGEIAEFETHFDRHRPDPPPTESWKSVDAPAHGSLYDLGTHLIDQVYHLFGMPKKVTGFVGRQRRGVTGGAPDSFTALLHYDGPLLVTAKAGVVSPEEEQLRYWVKGTKGSFKKFHLDVQEDQLRLHGIRPGQKDFGVDPESHYGTLITVAYEKAKPVVQKYPTVQPATYVEYYRIFADALKGKGDVPVKAEDARDVLQIIEAVELSSQAEKTVHL